MFVNREISNVGCHICPSCGETKRCSEYVKNGIYDKGIMSEIEKIDQNTCCDNYICYTCGKNWKGKAYNKL